MIAELGHSCTCKTVLQGAIVDYKPTAFHLSEL
jgi:hypothetical protein